MIGRESKVSNDIFFVCGLIEYVARLTNNRRSDVVNLIGRSKLQHFFELADVYHSENIDKIANDLILKYHIQTASYNNIVNAKYSIPSHWDISKVFTRLIVNVFEERNSDPIDVLIEIYNSWICDKLQDYNSSLYYENPDYLFQSYKAGQLLA